MLSWLAPVLVFGLVVLVHEVGHFLAAKLVGVYAPRFSIGFGKALWRRRRGETEYVLSLLPLGGYVRMASREDEAMAMIEGGGETAEQHGAEWDPEAMMPFGPKPVPPHRWFESKTLPARLLILIAGVTMNVVLALTINMALVGTNPRLHAVTAIDSVVSGRPASRAGLQRGDSIVAVNGVPAQSWSELQEIIRSSAGTPLRLDVHRGSAQLTITVTPEMVSDTTDPGARRDVGQIGVLPKSVAEPRTLASAITDGWRLTWSMGGAVINVVGGLLSGKVSVSQLGGPIAIAKSSVQAAQSGWQVLFELIAFLSINVAVLNILPIPILDGGQILINVIEAAKGSAFSARTREYILRAGLLAIALLFALVMFNDLGLRKLFG
jgi:regulator of sigma E protease